MQTRRETLKQSAVLAGLLAATGLFPRHALAAFNKAAFDAKSVPDAVKAYGGGAPAESKDVMLTAPDIAENGAVVPFTIATSLPGVKYMLLLVEKNPSALIAKFDVTDAVEPNILSRQSAALGRPAGRQEGSEGHPGWLRRLNWPAPDRPEFQRIFKE